MIDLLQAISPGPYLHTFANLQDDVSWHAISVIKISSLILIVLLVAAVISKYKFPKFQHAIFALVTLTLLFSGAGLIGSTLYLHNESLSNTPIRTYADFQFWGCGTEINLRDPSRLSHSIGSGTFFEKNDNRMHFEGYITDNTDATLGSFLHDVGGSLNARAITIPTNNGQHITYKTGDTCENFSGELQIFAYRTNTSSNTFSQYKLTDVAIQDYFNISSAESYKISDIADNTQADCIIFEFDTIKSRTDKICPSLGERAAAHCTQFGVPVFEVSEKCLLQEVPHGIITVSENDNAICGVIYDANGKVIDVNPIRNYDDNSTAFDPQRDCSNYKKEDNKEPNQ